MTAVRPSQVPVEERHLCHVSRGNATSGVPCERLAVVKMRVYFSCGHVGGSTICTGHAEELGPNRLYHDDPMECPVCGVVGMAEAQMVVAP